MKVYPEKLTIYDDEVGNILFTVTGVDQNIIEMTANSLWLTTPEEINEMCAILKKCLQAYEEGL